MINLGNINIKDLYVGSKPIQKAYVGTQLVYLKEDPIYSDYYGVFYSYTQKTSAVNRIGNKEYHKTLPLQSQMKGCTIDASGTIKYLKSDDWTKYEDGTDRDYTLNTMVEIPEFWILYVYDSDGVLIRLYQHEIPDTPNAEHYTKLYCSAYEASLVDDTLNSINTGDARPVVNVPLLDMQNYARNNGDNWNAYTYRIHKAITMLYVVEYANFNGQLDVNNTLTEDNYKQGGIGVGATTEDIPFVNGVYVNNLISCGITDAIGNGSGEVTVLFDNTRADGSYIRTITIKPNRYRGIENPFGNVTKAVIDIIVKMELLAGNVVYIAEDPDKFNGNIANYREITLTVYEGCKVNRIAFDRGRLELFANTSNDALEGYDVFTDSQFYNDTTTSKRVEIGGALSYLSVCGWFCLFCDKDFNEATSNCGTRLTYLP